MVVGFDRSCSSLRFAASYDFAGLVSKQLRRQLAGLYPFGGYGVTATLYQNPFAGRPSASAPLSRITLRITASITEHYGHRHHCDRMHIPQSGLPGRCGAFAPSRRAGLFYDGGLATLAAFRRRAPSTSWKPLFSEVWTLSMARVSSAASGGRRPLTVSRLRKVMLP